MPALQVRDMPDELYERLKARAAAERRSIAQQTVVCLEESLAASEAAGAATDVVAFRRSDDALDSKEARQRRIQKRRRLHALMDENCRFEVPEGFPSAAELIREDRDSR